MLLHNMSAVAAMPEVFDSLLAKGYKFVTVSELIAMDEPVPRMQRGETGTSAEPR